MNAIVNLGSHCTIEGVRGIADSFIGALGSSDGISVDASAVERMDISVLQLIVSAQKECESRGWPFQLVGGDALAGLAARAGLQMQPGTGSGS